jgi:hypothetical protein
MELGVCFFHERHPEFLGVVAVAVERRLALAVVWYARVDDDVLPFPILEELEHSEAVLDAVIHDQVFEQVWVRAQDEKRAKEPAVTKNALLDVAWAHGVFEHYRLASSVADLLRAFPLNNWHVKGVFGWIDWIIVQTGLVCWKFRVSKESLVLNANLDNLLDLVLNPFFLGWLLIVIPLLMHHLISVLVHLLAVLLVLSQHLLVLLRTDRYSILSYVLVWVILSRHHLLLGVLLLLIELLLVSLLLLWGHLAEVNLVHLHLHLLLVLHLLVLLLCELHHVWVLHILALHVLLVNHFLLVWVVLLLVTFVRLLVILSVLGIPQLVVLVF